jgi:hypothetical protein
LFAGTFVREDDRGMPPHSVAKRPTSYGHNGVNSDVLNPSGFCSFIHIIISPLLPKTIKDHQARRRKIDIQKLHGESY